MRPCRAKPMSRRAELPNSEPSRAEGRAEAGVDVEVTRGEELSRRRHKQELGARSRGSRKERSWSRGSSTEAGIIGEIWSRGGCNDGDEPR